jgi:hypothetical protein
MDRLLTLFGVERDKDEPPHDVFPLGTAPFIRLSVEGQEGGKPALIAEDGMFGLLPHFATEMQYGRRRCNARSETCSRARSMPMNSRIAWLSQIASSSPSSLRLYYCCRKYIRSMRCTPVGGRLTRPLFG